MADNEIKNSEEISASSSSDSQQQAAPKPGALLGKYREKAGMSVEQVASRLKMTNRQVQLIEADNYESMYSMAIARGFIRAYARLLNVDPEPLAAMLPADKPGVSLPIQAKRGAQEPFAGNRQPFRSRRLLPVKLIGLLIAAVIVIGGILMVWRSGWLPSFGKGAKETAGLDSQSKKNLSKDSQQKGKASATGSVSTELALPKSILSDDAQKQSNASAPDAAPENPAASAPASSTPAAEPVAKPESVSSDAPKSRGALVLRARETSWVQIVRADSTVLYERTLVPGQTETIEIREPVAVTIGYAPGVEATFRGSSLALKTPEGSPVARLNLK